MTSTATAPTYLGYQEAFADIPCLDSVNAEIDPRMTIFMAPITYNEKTNTYNLSFGNSNYGSTNTDVVHAIQNRCLGNPLELDAIQTGDTKHADSNEQDMVLTVGSWDRVSTTICRNYT